MDGTSITPQDVIGFVTANLLVFAALYFIPAIVAALRGHCFRTSAGTAS